MTLNQIHGSMVAGEPEAASALCPKIKAPGQDRVYPLDAMRSGRWKIRVPLTH